MRREDEGEVTFLPVTAHRSSTVCGGFAPVKNPLALRVRVHLWVPCSIRLRHQAVLVSAATTLSPKLGGGLCVCATPPTPVPLQIFQPLEVLWLPK